MSAKIYFFLFIMLLAIAPTLLFGWVRIGDLEGRLTKLELSPSQISTIVNQQTAAVLATSLVISVFALFFAFALFRAFAEPIDRITEGIRNVRAKNFSVRIPTQSNTPKDEISEIELAFNDMANELSRYIKKMEEADRAKDNFLAIMSHELRNPMAVIVTTLDLLRMNPPSDPEVARQVSLIDRQVSHLSRLLDYLLDISRLKQGKVTINIKRTDFTFVLRDAIEAVAPLAEQRKVTIVSNLRQEPLFLDGDPVRLVQVMTNLLKNAVEHSKTGGDVVISSAQKDHILEIIVRDTGAGITKEDLDEIFDLFVRGASSKHKPAGLGVGLYLAKTLTQMHGGTIVAESDGLEKGATFRVRLPLVANP